MRYEEQDMRQLASIQEVAAVTPIPNADAIEKVTVLGWHVVAKKGEHRPGDRVVYCEIDSLLPERPEFEFLRANSYKAALTNIHGEAVLPAGFRIKTIKLRGQVSQGICFPLSILPEGTSADVGADVTEALGILKWEIPEQLGGVRGLPRSTFPVDIPKTDETRVQNLGGLLHACRGQRFVMTEKLDGSSFTAFVRGDEFGVCSRNQLLDPADMTHAFCALASRLGLAEKMRRVGTDFAIQGEVIGPKIQGNKYALTEHMLYLFDGYWIKAGAYMSPGMLLETAAELGFATVPDLGSFVLEHSIDEVVAMSEGKSKINSKIEREGIVLRPDVPGVDDRGNRISFKAINPRFLLKYEA
jgi:RNA ligase (TIGR02306 family)